MATSDTSTEESLAHLMRTVDELSDVVARQDKELTALRRQMDAVLEVMKEGMADGGSVVIGERPPHY